MWLSWNSCYKDKLEIIRTVHIQSIRVFKWRKYEGQLVRVVHHESARYLPILKKRFIAVEPSNLRYRLLIITYKLLYASSKWKELVINKRICHPIFSILNYHIQYQCCLWFTCCVDKSCEFYWLQYV